MAWQTPKTDWGAADGVRDTDFNRIEGNILELYNSDALRVAKTVYVSTSGNDTSGAGTQASPYRTITKALNSLPRNLNGLAATINIAAGTYAENVLITGFAGPIKLTGAAAAQATVNSFIVDGCVCILEELMFVLSGTGATVRNGGVLVGTGGFSVSNASISLSVHSGSKVSINRLTSNSATQAAISADGASNVNVSTLGGSGNLVGMLVQGGSTASYVTNNMAATTLSRTFGGGRVYTGSQGSTLAAATLEEEV